MNQSNADLFHDKTKSPNPIHLPFGLFVENRAMAFVYWCGFSTHEQLSPFFFQILASAYAYGYHTDRFGILCVCVCASRQFFLYHLQIYFKIIMQPAQIMQSQLLFLVPVAAGFVVDNCEKHFYNYHHGNCSTKQQT